MRGVMSPEQFLAEMYAPVVARGMLSEREAEDAIALIIDVNARVAAGLLTDEQADLAMQQLADLQLAERRGGGDGARN